MPTTTKPKKSNPVGRPPRTTPPEQFGLRAEPETAEQFRELSRSSRLSLNRVFAILVREAYTRMEAGERLI